MVVTHHVSCRQLAGNVEAAGPGVMQMEGWNVTEKKRFTCATTGNMQQQQQQHGLCNFKMRRVVYAAYGACYNERQLHASHKSSPAVHQFVRELPLLSCVEMSWVACTALWLLPGST